MKKSLGLTLMGLALLSLSVTGCKKDQGPPTQVDPPGVVNETTAMQVAALNDQFVVNDEATFADTGAQTSNFSTFGKVNSAIIPLRWGRIINPGGITRTTTVTVLPGDTIALVNVQREILGNLVIIARSDSADTSFILVKKPFHDHSNRNIVFRRKSHDGLFMGRWVPVASSLVDGATVPPNSNIAIQSATVFYPNGDSLVVTNPDTTFLLYRWTRLFARTKKEVPEFVSGDRVKLRVTVVSKDATGDFVALRYGVGGHDGKRALMDLVPGSEIDNGNGTWTRTYETSRNVIRYLYMPVHAGWFHLGIDAVTKETLVQSPAPYSAAWWGVPYRVY